MDPEEHSRRGNVEYFKTVDIEFLKNYRLEKSGGTCLHIAASNGQLEICKVIYKRCPSLIFVENSYGNTFFHHVYGERLTSMLQFFLEMGAKVEAEGNMAIKSRYKHLLETVNCEGQTALCRGIENGMIDEEPSNHDITKLWIKADEVYDLELLTMLNRSKQTLLHSAVENQDLELVNLLLDAKPSFVYGDDHNGETPLKIAIRKTLSHETSISAEIRYLLLEKQSIESIVKIEKKSWSVLAKLPKRIQDIVPHLRYDIRGNRVEEVTFEDARDDAFRIVDGEVKDGNVIDLVVISIFAAVSLATVFLEPIHYITDGANSMRIPMSASFRTFATSNMLGLMLPVCVLGHYCTRYFLKRS
ncbi:hypothetical protein ACHQM5_010695 [Ranunculus cassubicifolius]